MNGIFISYRRDDSAGYAGRLYDRLIAAFGKDRVFMDVEGIELGTDFIAAIERALDSSSVFIALIGSEWTQSKDAVGRRRLDDPHDFIRLETAMAIERKLRIVPVLVDDAAMPHADELPPEMASLARRHAIEINHRQWDASTGALIQALKPILEASSAKQGGSATNGSEGHRRALLLALGVLVAIGIAGLAYFSFWRDRDPAPELPKVVEAAPKETPKEAPKKIEKPPVSTSAAPKPPPSNPARIEASVSTMDFGVMGVGSAGTLSLRLRNSGDIAADLAAPVVRGQHAADYRVAKDCGKQLLGGASCSVEVSFKPGAAGTRSATMQIGWAGSERNLKVALSGSGKAPTPEAPARDARTAGSAPSAKAVEPPRRAVVGTATPSRDDAAPPPRHATASGRLSAGDRWTYRVKSKWGNVRVKTLQFAVTAAEGDTATLVLTELGVESPQTLTRQRVSGNQAAILEWLGFGKEFSPFIGAFGGLGADARWSGMSASEPSGFIGRFSCRGKAAGSEQVRVPAGAFDATIVSIDCHRQTSGSVGEKAVEVVWIHFDVWYAPAVKRYVKLVRREVTVDRTEADKDTVELIDYRLVSASR